MLKSRIFMVLILLYDFFKRLKDGNHVIKCNNYSVFQHLFLVTE